VKVILVCGQLAFLNLGQEAAGGAGKRVLIELFPALKDKMRLAFYIGTG
jgi:hypothetical protein